VFFAVGGVSIVETWEEVTSGRRMDLPPFDVDDAVKKSNDFCDASKGYEGVDPGHGLVAEELAEFLETADFDELRLLHFA